MPDVWDDTREIANVRRKHVRLLSEVRKLAEQDREITERLGQLVPNEGDNRVIRNRDDVIIIARRDGLTFVDVPEVESAISVSYKAATPEPLDDDVAVALHDMGWGQALPVSDEVTP
jgi:hypothetical protein